MKFLEFIKDNSATLAVLAILAVTVAAIVVKLVRDKRAGKSSCGCGCADCPMSNKCHPKDDAAEE